MKTGLSGLAFAAALLMAEPAAAWGAQGHQYVGNLGERLLNPKAAQQVRSLLGHDMGTSAVWADCIRDVETGPGGAFTWVKSQFSPRACDVFAKDPAEKARMESYAARNWTNCEYAGARTSCNLSYHFADVAIQRSQYARGLAGTGDNDVVHALIAALLVLQDKPAPSPFNIRDKKEALFLLIHFTGDLHQPLHVGAVYLDPKGVRLDPDATPGDDKAAETTGGNWLLFASDNLHHTWDAIDPALGVQPSAAAVTRARLTPATGGALPDRPMAWASDSIVVAHGAFSTLNFGPANKSRWNVVFDNAGYYTGFVRTVQQQQLEKAGARLAEVLNAIWPG